MIHWDSREAEERNARQLLAECSRNMQRARRRMLRYTVELVVLPLAILGCITVSYFWQTAPFTGVVAAALSALIWIEFQARRRAVRTLPVHEARLRHAQENHNRVFGGQR